CAERAGSVQADQSYLAGASLLSPRRSRSRGLECLERCSDQSLSALGHLWSEQSRATSFEQDLERRTDCRGYLCLVARSGGYGYTAARDCSARRRSIRTQAPGDRGARTS